MLFFLSPILKLRTLQIVLFQIGFSSPNQYPTFGKSIAYIYDQSELYLISDFPIRNTLQLPVDNCNPESKTSIRLTFSFKSSFSWVHS